MRRFYERARNIVNEFIVLDFDLWSLVLMRSLADFKLGVQHVELSDNEDLSLTSNGFTARRFRHKAQGCAWLPWYIRQRVTLPQRGCADAERKPFRVQPLSNHSSPGSKAQKPKPKVPFSKYRPTLFSIPLLCLYGVRPYSVAREHPRSVREHLTCSPSRFPNAIRQ
jgi:hypothetical protein